MQTKLHPAPPSGDSARAAIFDDLMLSLTTVGEQRAFIAGIAAVLIRLGVPAIELTHADIFDVGDRQADMHFQAGGRSLVVEIVSKV